MGLTMNDIASVKVNPESSLWREYLELCKPRVVLMMVLTSVVGMCLSAQSGISWVVFICGNLGIGLASASAAAINHLYTAPH